MTLNEFADRIKARLAQAQKAEDEHMTSTVLAHDIYCKRVGASLAYGKAAELVEEELKMSGLDEDDLQEMKEDD